MSVTVQEILQELKAFAPPELACSWDNVGLLVDAGRPVDKILTALDITAGVVQEAAEAGCQLIVSHHPVIFDPIKRITAQDVPALLLQKGISGICMHTNLDAAEGGVNDLLADTLGIAREGRRTVELTGTGACEYIINGRLLTGTWERETLEDYTRYYLDDGSLVTLEAGNTWIEVIPTSAEIVVS